MINILIPVIEKEKKFVEIVSKLAYNEGINVIVGTTKKFKNNFQGLEADNVSIHIFEDGRKYNKCFARVFNRWRNPYFKTAYFNP